MDIFKGMLRIPFPATELQIIIIFLILTMVILKFSAKAKDYLFVLHRSRGTEMLYEKLF